MPWLRLEGDPELAERFVYADSDRFPVDAIAQGARRDGPTCARPCGDGPRCKSADAVAAEVERFLKEATVRDRHGPPRVARGLTTGHPVSGARRSPVYEAALENAGIRPTLQGPRVLRRADVQDCRRCFDFSRCRNQICVLRSFCVAFVRLSDPHSRPGPGPVGGLRCPDEPAIVLADQDRPCSSAFAPVRCRWIALTDRVPPGELSTSFMRESVYAVETSGLRAAQARENVKKVRALVRR